jgi:hypothetical protein
MAVQKTRVEFEDEFREAVANLKTLSEEYERGNEAITKPLANTIYTLVYDRGTNHSLLRHLKRKDVEYFAPPQLPGPKRPGYMPLVHGFVEHSSWPGAVPIARVQPVYWCFVGSGDPKRLDHPGAGNVDWERVPFTRWWEDTILVTEKARMSRRDIILMVTNKIGGRHSSHVLSDDHASVIRKEVASGTIEFGGRTQPFKIVGLHRAHVRQIAYELQNTIDATCRDLLTSPATVPPKIPSSSGASIIRDRSYLEGVLAQLIDQGEGDSEQAYWMRSLIYWDSRDLKLPTS